MIKQEKYIERKKIGNTFIYYIDNKKINDKNVLDEIKKIYIAPAYTNVKIYLNKNVLATGIDIAGRKQYIYSDGMKQKRELKKYNKLIHISNNIDNLKKKINKDLLNKKFTMDKLVALVLKIMDLCNFRGGNKIYEKKYGSYGITTIHKKHVSFKKDSVEIDFVGKKGVNNHCIIKNKAIQDIIKKIYNISSNNNPYIFSINYDKKLIHLTVLDINKYLEKFNITSKDLRTWNANLIFLKNLKNEIMNLKTDDLTITMKKKIIKNSIKNTADSLHHTSAICKSSYIYKKLLHNIETNNNIIKIFKKNINTELILKKYLLTL